MPVRTATAVAIRNVTECSGARERSRAGPSHEAKSGASPPLALSGRRARVVEGFPLAAVGAQSVGTPVCLCAPAGRGRRSGEAASGR